MKRLPSENAQLTPPSGAVKGGEPSRGKEDEQAIRACLAEAVATEVPSAAVCLKLAKLYKRVGRPDESCRWALAVVDAADDFLSWHAAASLARGCVPAKGWPERRRSARLALLGSYTTSQYASLLWLAALRLGIELEIYESQFGQYRQDILDPQSRMYAFGPDFVVLAIHEGELGLPDLSLSPSDDLEAEAQRWTTLWQVVSQRAGSRVVQHNFAIPCEAPMGHLGARLPGSRYALAQALNLRLGERAGDSVAIIDCERLASEYGKRRWFDPRYWHLSKQAVALDALPLLARHTAAVLAADLGLGRKCLVLDLDNTLWGGVIGEDGLDGVKLGGGGEGEAFVAFQEYLLRLKKRGVILTVCSKNNEADAKEPFEKHPEMRLKLGDVAMFVSNWDGKPDGIRAISRGLNIGLDSIVFVDDNPAERQAVRQFLPEVDVIPLPADPAHYVRALSQYLLFENKSFTPEDAQRTEQYQARARIAAMEASAESLADFYRGLRMRAIVAPFDDLHLPRIAQLIGKTNQFNLTTRRHSIQRLREFMDDPGCVHLYLRLRDRFTDHGLVALIIAFGCGDALEIDTWLMSCRVIGRTVEAELLKHLSQQAQRSGFTKLRGIYIPTTKNQIVKDVYARFGFTRLEEKDGTESWMYDLQENGPIENDFIETAASSEEGNDASRQA